MRALIMGDEHPSNAAPILAGNHFELIRTLTPKTMLQIAKNRRFDLLLMEFEDPSSQDFQVCRELRRNGIDAPILILTGTDRVEDRVAALQAGADDVAANPCGEKELIARVEALLRRVHKPEPETLEEFRLGSLRVNFLSGEAFRRDARIRLTRTEVSLLRCLVENCGSLLMKDDLLARVWGADGPVSKRTVDVHISSLRRKLEEHPRLPRHLVTVRGLGYTFRPE